MLSDARACLGHYAGANGSALFVRALDQLDATRLTGLGAPHGPFLSLDGQWIGFVDGIAALKKVALSGGPAVLLGQFDGGTRGATWGPDNTIVFATTNITTGLQQIPAAGGAPTVLTRPNRAGGEADHFWPEFLPDGQAVLFMITATTGGLDTPPVQLLEGRYFAGAGGLVVGRTYDVSPDGRRFLMIKPGGGTDSTAAPTSLVVVQNWFEELKRLVPTRQ